MSEFEIVEEEKKKPNQKQIVMEYLKSTESIIHHKGKTYKYVENKYVEQTEMHLDVRRWLMGKNHPHNTNFVMNMIADIQAIARTHAKEFKTMPFYIGGDDFPSQIIAYKNGLLDIDKYLTGDNTLIPHTAYWVSTVCLPYEFLPDAVCPKWHDFLSEVFEDDTGRISLFQEWCGYCLLPDTSQHKLLCKIGPPRAGKGTTDRIQQALLGSDNTTGYNLHYLADKFGLVRLIGKYVAFVGEINLANSRDKYRILETLNSIVGEDEVLIDEKYSSPQSMRLPTRFNLSCNEMPSFVDPSGALAERLLLLNFNRSFAGKEDRELDSKLLTEISGICNWALAGLTRLRRNGKFSDTEDLAKTRTEFRRDNSHAYAYLMDCCQINAGLNPGNLDDIPVSEDTILVRVSDLEDSYHEWCQLNHQQNNFGWFCRNLKTMMPNLQVERSTVNGKRIRIYHGLGLV